MSALQGHLIWRPSDSSSRTTSKRRNRVAAESSRLLGDDAELSGGRRNAVVARGL